MTVVLGMPQRDKKLAKKALEGNLPLRLAQRMLKYCCAPKAQARNHWKKEIAELLRQLQFGVAARTQLVGKRPTRKRKITELHFETAKVEGQINALTMDASQVLENLDEGLELPDNFEEGNLVDYGWSLKESSQAGAIVWTLSYGDQVIATAP